MYAPRLFLVPNVKSLVSHADVKIWHSADGWGGDDGGSIGASGGSMGDGGADGG